jgi:hypothetical protein
MAKKQLHDPATESVTQPQMPLGKKPSESAAKWAAGLGVASGITAVTVATVYTVGSKEAAELTFEFAFKSVMVLGVLGTASLLFMCLKK